MITLHILELSSSFDISCLVSNSAECLFHDKHEWYTRYLGSYGQTCRSHIIRDAFMLLIETEQLGVNLGPQVGTSWDEIQSIKK